MEKAHGPRHQPAKFVVDVFLIEDPEQGAVNLLGIGRARTKSWLGYFHHIPFEKPRTEGLSVAARRFFAEPCEFVVKHIRDSEQQQADRKLSLFNVGGRNYLAMLTAARAGALAR
jgi:hypothetical protein